MLISMPTGTSTIFGVFQVIRVSQVVCKKSLASSLARRRAEVEPRTTPDLAQVRKTERRTASPRPDDRYFSPGQNHFALGPSASPARVLGPSTPSESLDRICYGRKLLGRQPCAGNPHPKNWPNRMHVRSAGDLSSALTVLTRIRLGALGLLRCRRLTLHLPLRILRRSRGVAAGLIHRAGRRMVLGISCHARRGLAAARRCRAGACIFEICGPAGGIARTCERAAGAQDKDRATGENELFRLHLHLLCPGARPGVRRQGETDPAASGSGWPDQLRYYLIRRFHVPAHQTAPQPLGSCEAIHAILVQGITRFVARNLSNMARDRAERIAARPDDIRPGNLASNVDGKGAPRQEMDG